MSRIDFEPWEPEESVGKLWHALASRLDAPQVHDSARVGLSEVDGRLAVLFRGLGGDAAVQIKPVADEVAHHRLSFLRRLGHEAERFPRASFDGANLRLPDSLAIFPDRAANGALYVWLTALAAHAPATPPRLPRDPLAADLAAIACARAMIADTRDQAPGLAPLGRELAAMALALRPVTHLPPAEAAIEALIRHDLGDPAALTGLAADMMAGHVPSAPRDYRPFRPVPVWPDLRPLLASATTEAEAADSDGSTDPATDARSRRARRRAADQADRKDSLILFKFEAILSWAEYLNLNRRVEDDDDDSARKAADDQDEIGLAQVSKAPATRLKLHLDLAPEDVNREALSGRFTYPEWDCRTGVWLPDHCVVLASDAEAADQPLTDDPASARRIRAVRRQFEALRPGRMMTSGHPEGDDLDIDAAIRSAADLRVRGQGNDRIWRQSRPVARDLAVSILLDVSRSTESQVSGGRSVIDIEREALTALAMGLEACGDAFAIHAFSSLRRDRVYVQTCKDFDQPMGPDVAARIASLRPGFYTRLGAAIRHVSAGLARQAGQRRLLLVITDGKPNDLDHYEGRHGIEDSRMAVREARRAGHRVFGITVDRQAKSWFPRIFGQGGSALVSHPDHLTAALPQIYRQLVGA
ncbi:nitric oxide reductase activation protein NorD [Paracoccus sp. p4-l81]|uniref:nitric oxide reductase activation protein NorD n=1 Tax=Paracoccus sp. p4-l81 TaxID=3342806 RepID=UPI0035B6E2C0